MCLAPSKLSSRCPDAPLLQFSISDAAAGHTTAPSHPSTPSTAAANEPSQQCVKAFNAIVEEKGACDSDVSSLEDCCSALTGLGTCLDSILAAMQQDPKYEEMLKTL